MIRTRAVVGRPKRKRDVIVFKAEYSEQLLKLSPEGARTILAHPVYKRGLPIQASPFPFRSGRKLDLAKPQRIFQATAYS